VLPGIIVVVVVDDAAIEDKFLLALSREEAAAEAKVPAEAIALTDEWQWQMTSGNEQRRKAAAD
jgi:hypothetical protein